MIALLLFMPMLISLLLFWLISLGYSNYLFFNYFYSSDDDEDDSLSSSYFYEPSLFSTPLFYRLYLKCIDFSYSINWNYLTWYFLVCGLISLLPVIPSLTIYPLMILRTSTPILLKWSVNHSHFFWSMIKSLLQ